MSSQLQGGLAYGDLVSVILPINSDWLASLESVVQQSYQPIELIVLDNSPDDSCLDKVRLWLAESNISQRFVRLVIEQSKQQVDLYKVINRGLALAQGKALSVLPAGDTYLPKRIERLMQTAENQGADWLITGIQVVNATGARTSTDLALEIEACGDFACFFPTISFALLKKNIVVSTGNLFFSHALYKQVGEFKHLPNYYAWDFALQACLLSEPILIQEPLYRYRIQPNHAFAAQTTAQSLEQKIVYRRFFSACHIGNCINTEAPWVNNWPGLFTSWIEADTELSQIYDQVGQDIVKYDRLANTIGLKN